MTLWVAVEHEDSLPGRHDDLVAPIAVHVDKLQIVNRVERRVGDFNGPCRVYRVPWNIMNDNANPLPVPPVRPLGSASLQGGNHELLSARAFHITEPQPVQRRFFE